MGNNKGRSNGCKTCLQRRLKCDETRPICTRCIAANFDCLGYRDSFIDEREQILRRLQPKGPSTAKSNSSPITTTPNQVLPSISQKPSDTQQICFPFQQPSVWPALSALPWKNDIVISHLAANTTEPFGTVCRDIVMNSYQPDFSQNTVTKLCVLALATTFFGISHGQDTLMHDGRRLYGLALQTLSATISNPNCSVNEVLSAVFALSLHEAIQPSQNNMHSWLNHIFGLEQLFAIPQPEAEKNGPFYRAMLENTRLIMIVASLSTRRPSLMAQPEWSAVGNPLMDDHLSASTLPYLLDTLAQIPQLYHEQDAIVLRRKQSSATDTEEASYWSGLRKLLRRSLYLLDDVRSNMTQWESSFPDSIFSSLPCTNIPSSHPYHFTVVTHFSSLDVANASTLCSSVVILLNQLALSLYKLLPSTELEVQASQSASDQISVAVLKILQSIDYYLTFSDLLPGCSLGASGSTNFYLLLPIRIAHRVLAQSELPEDVSQRTWLEEVASIIENKAGPWASNKHLFHVVKK